MFWKKKEPTSKFGRTDSFSQELGLPSEDHLGLGNDFNDNPPSPHLRGMPQIPSMDEPSSVPPSMQPMQHQSYHQSSADNKDLEIISAKLDTIRASLESINQRLAALEHIAKQSNDHNW